MRNQVIVVAISSALALGASAAAAQSPQGSMSGMSGKSMDKGAMAGMAGMSGKGSHNMMAMNEFMASMKKMDKAMMSAKGSTTDAAFARKMIAHHQGAIDMAQVELKHGTDADAKRLAQQTIDENTKGVADLSAWLKAHGG
jgi:uncharacterized protein (DUF305 family)